MREIVKVQLLELVEKLEVYIDSYPEINDDLFPLYFPQEAEGVGVFFKKIAISLNDFELLGISEKLINLTQKITDLEEESNRLYEEWRSEQYYEDIKTKEFYTATDITVLLNLEYAAKTNIIIADLGYQIRKNGGWVATSRADGLCKQEGVEESVKPYVRWLPKFLKILELEIKNADSSR